jgi:hypothetical protein
MHESTPSNWRLKCIILASGILIIWYWQWNTTSSCNEFYMLWTSLSELSLNLKMSITTLDSFFLLEKRWDVATKCTTFVVSRMSPCLNDFLFCWYLHEIEKHDICLLRFSIIWFVWVNNRFLHKKSLNILKG